MLESAQADIELFRKELGKDQVNLHDRYEQLKKELRQAIGQMKDMVKENKALAKDLSEALRQRLSALEAEVQSPLPRVSEAELHEQLARIRHGLDEMITYLSGLRVYNFSVARLMDNMYRYRIKFAILRLKVQLGALEVKDSFMDIRHDVKKKIQDIQSKMERSGGDLEKRWDHVRDEVTAAYEHLQKAFTSK
jgi:gas vesicle protein